MTIVFKMHYACIFIMDQQANGGFSQFLVEFQVDVLC